MFYFLFRLIGALIAAAVASCGVLIVGAVSLDDDSSPALWAVLVILMFAAAAVAFLWMFRRLGSGKWAQRHAESQIRALKARAVRRAIGSEATLVSTVLGGGSYATGTLRASWDGVDSVSVDAAEGGVWRTVFAGRFHPEVPGQVVPSRISTQPTWHDKKHLSISTSRVGHKAAWWEVQAYIPGDWEEELHRLWEAAKEAKHEQEKDRFGL